VTGLPGTGLPAAGVAAAGGGGLRGAVLRLARSRGFQRVAARVPGLAAIVRGEGAAIFDLVAGFVHSQALMALVELRVLHHLEAAPAAPAELGARVAVPADRMAILLQAGAALGLLRRRRDGRFDLTLRGAAVLGVPGLEGMIAHHRVLYADLGDPVAFLRGETDPALARFWPYVFGAGAAADPGLAARYSQLMADSQTLVAEDTLRLVDLRGVRHLMDVGGGTGAFLRAVAAAHPALRLTLFDLPAVVAAARLPPGAAAVPGSFRDDVLPAGADAISLVRVLYDHADATVAGLLARVHAALPPGGQLIVSEPMSGGDRPDRSTDTYFAFYTLAMRTGRTRSGAELAAMVAAAGFTAVRHRPGPRPYVTGVVTARRA
jgi:demethylspheroidene O-methyltransferase